MSILAERFVAGFEATYGYPPGEHYVSRATDSVDRDALAAVLGDVDAGNLVEFYSHGSRISLPDVGSGLFVDAAKDVVEGLRGGRPTQVLSVQNRGIVVFGSDGGGALFAADRQTAEIVRLEGGSLVGVTYEVEEFGVQVIASSFEGFMQFLYGELLRRIPSVG